MEDNKPIVSEPFDSPTSRPVSPTVVPMVVAPSSNYSPPSPQNYSTYQTPLQMQQHRFLRVGIVLGTLLIIVVFIFLWFYKPAIFGRRTTQRPATIATPKIPAPLVTTSSPATLPAGTFTVGPDKNIIPSLYSLSPGPQQTGSFTIITPTATYSVTLNDAATLGNGTRVAWAQLSSGDKIQISGGNLTSVIFKSAVLPPTAAPALVKLYTASFTVTDDPKKANPGKYLISDSLDKNADILILAKDYTIKYNQPLNSTEFLVDLVDGDQVATVNVSHFDMKPR
ncbi:MAG TPA: hypothetical protein VLG92_03425 [Candidatus Saccharimonadia bacterium]|nr:hypothetical protein [Candidatus Saccharimonadia bacterium]